MASNDEAVRRVLALLDRHSIRTLEHAVLQFKDHSRRFHESISELKSLKLSAGEGFLQRCSPLKTSLIPDVIEGGVENHESRRYILRSRGTRKLSTTISVPQRVTRSRAKQSLMVNSVADSSILSQPEVVDVKDSSVDKRGRKSKKHIQGSSHVNFCTGDVSDHERTSRKLSSGVLPATCAAMGSNVLRETKCFALEEESNKAVNKKGGSYMQYGYKYSQGDSPKAAPFDGEWLYPSKSMQNQAPRANLQPLECIEASQKELETTKENLLTPTCVDSYLNSEKHRSGLKNTESSLNKRKPNRQILPFSPQYYLHSKRVASSSPFQRGPEYSHHVCTRRSIQGVSNGSSLRHQSVNMGVAMCPKSPNACRLSQISKEQTHDNEVKHTSHQKEKKGKLLYAGQKAGSSAHSPAESIPFGLHNSLSISKETWFAPNEKFHEIDGGNSISHKRKFSVNELSTYDQDQQKDIKRVSLSCNSPIYEAFVIDEKSASLTESPHQDVFKDFSFQHPMKNLSNSKDMARTKQSIDLENNNIVYNDTLYSLSVNRVASEGQNKDPQSRDITGKFVDSLKFDPGISHIQNSSLPDNPKGTAETDYQAFVSNECREISSENMKQYNMNQLKSSEWHSSFLIEHVGVNSATQSPLRFHLEHEAIQTQTAGTCTLEQGEDKPTLGSSFEEFNNSSQSQHIEDHRIVDDSADSGVLDLNGIYGYNVPSIGSSPSNLQPQENNRASFCHMNSPLSNVQKGVPITSNSELLNRSSELAAEIVASVENEEAGCFRARNSSFEFRVSKTNVPCLSEGLSSPEAKDDGLSTQILHSDDHQTFIKDMSIHFNSTIPIELAISNTPHQSNSHHDSPLMAPILISKINESLKSNFGGLLPKMETKDCCIEHKLATPFSQNVEMQSLSTADAALHCTFESDASSLLSSRAWKHEIRTEPSGCIPDEEILEGALDGNNSDGISDNENQMDCSESPCPSFSLQEDNPDELEEVGTRACYNFTSEDGVLKSNKKLANGSVNSCRRKRVRSLGACTEASQKVFKRMKLMPAERDVLNKDEGFMCLGFSKSPALGPNSRSFNRFSHFSPIRKFIKLECSTKSLEPQEMDGIKLSKSYSRLPILRKDYVDTPNMRPAKGVIDRVVNKSKLECHLESHLEKDEKENHYPEALIRAKRYSNISLHSDIQTTVISRKVLTNANHSFGAVESPQKCHHLTGKRDLRVKALEAAENARKQEEKRENGRRLRRLESNDAKSMDSELIKDKQHNFSFAVVGKGVTEKVKRVADLKMKMDQEKARKQEMEQRKKEEERKKKEAEFADKKRKREEAERRDREEKRKRVEEVQRLRREQEERQRIELEEKELKRKMLEERERERKAQEEEAKKQRRLEKEKEAERRRRHDQDLKAARLIEKQVERKRKEVIVQAKGNEDDESTVHVVRENKLSYMSMESFTVNSSMDLGTKAKSKIRTRSQMSEDNWRLRVLSCGISAYSQKSSEKLMSVVENEPDVPFQPIMSGRDPKSEMLKNKTLSHSTPSNNMGIGLCMPAQSMSSAAEIQSYEISPYRSSSDDDDEDDDQPKKPVPLWARKENLLQQLEWQQGIDPDRIFSTEKTCSLAEIFGTTGSRRRRNFMQRSTSGDWLEDHATWKEQLEYKKAMGYI